MLAHRVGRGSSAVSPAGGCIRTPNSSLPKESPRKSSFKDPDGTPSDGCRSCFGSRIDGEPPRDAEETGRIRMTRIEPANSMYLSRIGPRTRHDPPYSAPTCTKVSTRLPEGDVRLDSEVRRRATRGGRHRRPFHHRTHWPARAHGVQPRRGDRRRAPPLRDLRRHPLSGRTRGGEDRPNLRRRISSRRSATEVGSPGCALTASGALARQTATADFQLTLATFQPRPGATTAAPNARGISVRAALRMGHERGT